MSSSTATSTPDGRWVVGLDGDRHAMIWDYESGGVVADLELDGSIYQIGFTAGGKYLLTAVSRKSMILDLTGGAVIDPRAFGKKRTQLRAKPYRQGFGDTLLRFFC